jgi:hypothetical protein
LAALAISAAALTSTAVPSNALGRIFPGHGPIAPQHFGGPPTKITCFACRLPRPYRPNPIWGHNWGHGYWGHRFWDRPVIVGGAAVAPVMATAASAPAPAEAAPQVPTGSCNCLTKQTLADGSVLFADICTQQSAIAPPQAVSAR